MNRLSCLTQPPFAGPERARPPRPKRERLHLQILSSEYLAELIDGCGDVYSSTGFPMGHCKGRELTMGAAQFELRSGRVLLNGLWRVGSYQSQGLPERKFTWRSLLQNLSRRGDHVSCQDVTFCQPRGGLLAWSRTGRIKE